MGHRAATPLDSPETAEHWDGTLKAANHLMKHERVYLESESQRLIYTQRMARLYCFSVLNMVSVGHST